VVGTIGAGIYVILIAAANLKGVPGKMESNETLHI